MNENIENLMGQSIIFFLQTVTNSSVMSLKRLTHTPSDMAFLPFVLKPWSYREMLYNPAVDQRLLPPDAIPFSDRRFDLFSRLHRPTVCAVFLI